jgi:hypothetical protein
MEAEAVWKEGIDNNAFGVLIYTPASGLYDFCVSRNDGAISHLITDRGTVYTQIDWDNRYGAELKEADSCRFRV